MKKQGPAARHFQVVAQPGENCPHALKKIHERLIEHISRKNTQLKTVHERNRYTAAVEYNDRISVYFGEEKVMEIYGKGKTGFLIKISDLDTKLNLPRSFLDYDNANEAFYAVTFHLTGELPGKLTKKLEPLMVGPENH